MPYKNIEDRRECQRRYKRSHRQQLRVESLEYYYKNRDVCIQRNIEYERKYPEIKKERMSRRLVFKNTRIMLDVSPRTGICTNCNRTVLSGEIQRTHIHHLQYDESNPLAHTQELCPSCHFKWHRENKKRSSE